eukprot:Clim_evm31s6 gene=Clim_evmTU31s6
MPGSTRKVSNRSRSKTPAKATAARSADDYAYKLRHRVELRHDLSASGEASIVVYRTEVAPNALRPGSDELVALATSAGVWLIEVTSEGMMKEVMVQNTGNEKIRTLAFGKIGNTRGQKTEPVLIAGGDGGYLYIIRLHDIHGGIVAAHHVTKEETALAHVAFHPTDPGVLACAGEDWRVHILSITSITSSKGANSYSFVKHYEFGGGNMFYVCWDPRPEHKYRVYCGEAEPDYAISMIDLPKPPKCPDGKPEPPMDVEATEVIWITPKGSDQPRSPADWMQITRSGRILTTNGPLKRCGDINELDISSDARMKQPQITQQYRGLGKAETSVYDLWPAYNETLGILVTGSIHEDSLCINVFEVGTHDGGLRYVTKLDSQGENAFTGPLTSANLSDDGHHLITLHDNRIIGSWISSARS